MPLGGDTDETVITRTGGPDRREGLDELATRLGGHVAEIGLGHHQHIGHLHDPRLEELKDIAGARLHDHGGGVGHVLDVGLRLAHAHGFDHHHVEGRRQSIDSLAGGRRQAAQPVAGRRGADQHAVVTRVVLDAHAVAEQGAARAFGGGVHGEDGHTAPGGAPVRDEPGQQRGLAGSGGPVRPTICAGASPPSAAVTSARSAALAGRTGSRSR